MRAKKRVRRVNKTGRWLTSAALCLSLASVSACGPLESGDPGDDGAREATSAQPEIFLAKVHWVNAVASNAYPQTGLEVVRQVAPGVAPVMLWLKGDASGLKGQENRIVQFKAKAVMNGNEVVKTSIGTQLLDTYDLMEYKAVYRVIGKLKKCQVSPWYYVQSVNGAIYFLSNSSAVVSLVSTVTGAGGDLDVIPISFTIVRGKVFNDLLSWQTLPLYHCTLNQVITGTPLYGTMQGSTTGSPLASSIKESCTSSDGRTLAALLSATDTASSSAANRPVFIDISALKGSASLVTEMEAWEYFVAAAEPSHVALGRCKLSTDRKTYSCDLKQGSDLYGTFTFDRMRPEIFEVTVQRTDPAQTQLKFGCDETTLAEQRQQSDQPLHP
jgi:hypothetical protein